jgi:hypothetical protein
MRIFFFRGEGVGLSPLIQEGIEVELVEGVDAGAAGP